MGWFKGELLGTFLLVFFGCGVVATAVALQAPVGLFEKRVLPPANPEGILDSAPKVNEVFWSVGRHSNCPAFCIR